MSSPHKFQHFASGKPTLIHRPSPAGSPATPGETSSPHTAEIQRAHKKYSPHRMRHVGAPLSAIPSRYGESVVVHKSRNKLVKKRRGSVTTARHLVKSTIHRMNKKAHDGFNKSTNGGTKSNAYQLASTSSASSSHTALVNRLLGRSVTNVSKNKFKFVKPADRKAHLATSRRMVAERRIPAKSR